MASPRRKAKRANPRAEKTLSLRGLASRLGVSLAAVQKGIASGRLSRSIGRAANGSPFVANPGLAAREWAAGATKPAPANGKGGGPNTLTQAQLRVAMQREQALDLSNQAKRGTLIDAEKARREAFECARSVRDALLNIPDRLAAEIAAEPDAARVHARLDGELRKALEAIAEVLAHGE